MDENIGSDDDGIESGDFEFNKGFYSFIYSAGDTLAILEITYSFIFQGVEDCHSIDIYRAVNEFNKRNVAIKASIIKKDKDGEVNIEFTYGVLMDASNDELNHDLEPAINILLLSPTIMSQSLTKNGVKHHKIEVDEDEGEEP